MADVVITRPEPGTKQTIASPEQGNFVLNFNTSELVPVKDGDNLVLNLPDDTSITLEGFYTQYNTENLPTFNLDGTEATAEQFFAALNEPDLMPAAGPGAGAGAAAAGGAGRFHQFGDVGLLGGIDHLGALDWGMNRGFEPETDLNSVGRNTDSGYYAAAATGAAGVPASQTPVNNPVTVVPTNPGTVPPGTVVPDAPATPGSPASPGNAGIGAVADVLQVYEKGLVNGDQSLIRVQGSMDISAPDGVASIVIGGVTVWENGALVPNVTVGTDEGTFSNIQYNPETGKLTYTYTLDQNTTEHGQPGEDNIAHNVPVTVTDVDGDSDTAYITVVISDDVPEAVDDYAEVTEGQTEPLIGNVLDNDSFGADGPNKDKSVELISDPKGEYGVITLNPDGTYSFVLDNDNPDVKALKPGETLEQTYKYTITDADGDTSTATITITINGVNNPVTVTPDHPSTPDNPYDPDDPNRPDDSGKPDNPDKPGTPDKPEDKTPEDKPGDPTDPDNPYVPNPGADVDQSVVVVKESDLRDGEPVKVSDSLTVNAPDGVATIVIGGKVIYENGELVPEEDRTIETDEGQLVITGFDPDTGKLTYEFTLERPTDEHDKPGTDSISHTFQVTVTDVDGDEGSSYITVVVRDDVPEAENDVNSVKEGQTEPITGNVLDNDTFGADGKNDVSYVELNGDGKGEYGTIVINPDGSYSFTLDNDNPDVKALKPGETLDQSFEYTITDKDGDTSTATITITINGVNNPVIVTPTDPEPIDPDIPDPDNPDPNNKPADAVSDRLVVHEKDLGGDEPVQVDGSTTITAQDGVATIVIGGVTVYENGSLVEGAEVRTDEGVLNNFAFDPSSGELTYTYTLEQNTLEHGPQGEDKIAHNLTVTVTDVDGDQASSTISVVVVDDVPVAKDDSTSIKEDAEEPVTGNVLDNDTEGADKWATDADGNITAVTNPGTYELTYGTLTINPDGSYSYERNDTGVPDKGAQDSFTYTVVDKDGDTSTATLTINLENVKPTPTEPDPDPDPDNPTPDDPNVVKHSIKLSLDDSETAGDKNSTDSQTADLFDGPEDFVSARFDQASVENIKIAGLENADKANWTISQDGQTLTGTFDNGAVVTVTLGQIALDGSISISASLNEAAQHLVGSDNINISGIGVEATDKGGSTAVNTNISIDIQDVKPVAEANLKEVEEGKTETGNVIDDASPDNKFDDYNEDQAGAFENGAAVSWNNLPANAVYHEAAEGKPGYYEVNFEGQGTVKLYDDGNYEFTADKNIDGLTAGSGNSQNLVFDYSIIDSDGDVADSTLTIVLKPNNDVPTVDPGPSKPDPIPDPDNPDNPPFEPESIAPGAISGTIVADEAAMAGADKGSGDFEHGYKGSASFDVQLNGEAGTVTLTYPALDENGKPILDADDNPVEATISFALPAVAEGMAATVALSGSFIMPNGVKIDLSEAVLDTKTNKWTVNFKYELTEAQDHINKTHVGEEDPLQNIFAIDVVDETGDSAPQRFFAVEVHDDGPVLNDLSVDGAYTKDDVPSGMDSETLPVNLISDTEGTVTINLTDLALGADKGPGNLITVNVTIPGEGENAEPVNIGEFTFTWAQGEDGKYGYQFEDSKDAQEGTSAEIRYDEDAGNWQLIWTRPAEDKQEQNENGTYNDNENDSYTFDVTVKDADDDAVSESITVSTLIKPVIKEPENPDDKEDGPGNPVEGPDLIADTLVTDDSWLAAGTGKGSDSDDSKSESDSAQGSFYVTLNGLPYVITIGDSDGSHAVISMNGDASEFSVKYFDKDGNEVEPSSENAVISGQYGQLSGLGVVQEDGHVRIDYTYTQTSAYQHDAEKVDNPDQIQDAEKFAIAIVDQVGNEANANIQIRIEDDEPVLDVLTAGNLLGNAVYDENGVLQHYTDDTGTVLGNLVHDTDAAITVNLTNLDLGADKGDGNSITVNVTIPVLDENGEPVIDENGETVSKTMGEFTFAWVEDEEGNGSYQLVESKGVAEGTRAEISLDEKGENWQLIWTRPAGDQQEVKDGAYQFNDNDSYTFDVEVTDSDGDTVSQDIVVNTLAKPVIYKPGDENKPDDPDVPGKPGSPIAEVTTDESYIPDLGTQHAPTGGEGQSAHDYKAESEFGLTLNGRDYTLTIAGKPVKAEGCETEIKTDDKGNLLIELDADGNMKDAQLAQDLADGKIVIDGEYGHLTNITIAAGVVNFSYVQTSAYDHGNDKNAPDTLKEAAEKFAITVDDHLNDVVTSSISVNIEDDAPEISVAAEEGELASNPIVAGESVTGHWSHDFGADLPDVQSVTISYGNESKELYLHDEDQSVTLSTGNGNLTVNSDGTYTFQSLMGAGGTKNYDFNFSITDSDGDTASSKLSFSVTDNTKPGNPAIEVESPRDDLIYGDEGGKQPGDVPTNDIIIADIHGQTTTPQAMNVALLVDLSYSLTAKGIQDMKSALYDSIDHLAELSKQTEGGEIKVLLVGFNSFARNYDEYTLNATNADGLKNIVKSFKLGGDSASDPYAKYVAQYSPVFTGATNYEHPMSLAQNWFENMPGQNNQTFLITDGVPTCHIEDTRLSSINNINTSNVNWNAWKPGSKATLTDGINNFYANETGVLFTDSTYEKPIFIETTLNRHGTPPTQNWKLATIVLQKNDQGNYEPHKVGGSYHQCYNNSCNEPDRFENISIANTENTFPGLDAVSDVHALGVGTAINQETLNKFNSVGDGIKLTDFSQITDIIKNTVSDILPGRDTVYGDEGRDILIGDRLSEELNDGKQANINALKAMIKEQGVSDAALGALIFGQHAEVAAKIDTFDADNKKGGDDVLVGGKDSDLLYGMGGNDILIGDGNEGSATAVIGALGGNGENIQSALDNVQKASVAELNNIEERLDKLNDSDARDGDDILYGGHGDDVLYGGGGNDILNGGTGNDVLIGGEGDDLLIGGAGNDVLFGGAGNDVLIGGDGEDKMFGGEGNDLIVFDKSDYLIDGGSGIDFMVADDGNKLTLDAMLNNYTENGPKNGQMPMVNDVEVLLKGVDKADSLTSMNDLASKYGFSFAKDKDGNDVLVLGDKWTPGENVADAKTTVYENADAGITLETTLIQQEDAGAQDQIILAQAQMQSDNG